MSANPRAIIYTRVSTGMQVENTSLEMQEAACKRKAGDMQAEVVGVFSDPGVSGAKFHTRPGIQAVLTALRSGAADSVIIYKMDRAGRDAGILREIRKEVQRAGAKLIFADGMNFENNATGNLMFTQLAGFAEFEKEMIRERTMSGRQAMAESGVQPCRSQSPYGYHIITKRDKIEGKYADRTVGEYVVIEEQAAVVREMFTWFDQGASLVKIRHNLNARGVHAPKSGKCWYPSSTRVILENPAYKGMAAFGKQRSLADENLTHLHDPTRRLKTGYRQMNAKAETWVTISIPAIVEPDLWERCWQELNRESSEKKSIHGGNPGRKYMLTGLVFCPSCGWRLLGTRRSCKASAAVSYYRCRTQGCPIRRHYRVDRLEPLTVKGILAANSQPEAVRDALRAYDDHKRRRQNVTDAAEERCRLEERLRIIQADLDHMKAAMLEGMRNGLTAADFAGEMKALSDQRRSAEERLRELSPVRPSPEQSGHEDVASKLAQTAAAMEKVFGADSEDLPTGEKQALLIRVIDRIVPNGDEEIDIFWKLQTLQLVSIKCSVKASGDSRFEVTDAAPTENFARCT